jgi:hypothetical protein
MIFRGTLRSICHVNGLGKYMNSQGILLKNFDSWAQQCTQRLVGHLEGLVQAAGRPCLYLPSSAISKEEQAMAIAQRDGIKEGLVCLLSCVEPCYSAGIRRNRQTRMLDLIFTQRKCKFLYVYLIHPAFGWMHIRIQSWIPFDVQVYINGRSYLHRRMEQSGIGHVQDDNCFTSIDDLSKAQGLMDSLMKINWVTTLRNLLAPYWPSTQWGLLPEGVERFYWTIRQSELATDVMFKDAASLAALYPRLCRYAIEEMSCQDILKFMGKSPSRFGGQATSSLQKLVQGVRVKHQVDANSIKMYDKSGTVLRVETTINQPRKLHVYRGTLDHPDQDRQWREMSKSVADICRRAELCRKANERYLGALASVGLCPPVASVLDPVSQPVVRQGRRERALRPISPDDSALFAVVMDGKNLLTGLTNAALQAAVFPAPPSDTSESRRRSNWAGRKLRLLRRHGLIHKLGPRRLYRVTPKGQQIMGLALALRQRSDTLLLVA